MDTSALQMEQWSIDRLIPYMRNPRRNDEVVDQMCAAIREFGFRIPIVAKSDGTVIDGHLRLKAARRLNFESVPVVLADDLNETQIKAFRLLANQSANWAAWDDDLLRLELTDLQGADYDLDIIGFSDGELDDLLSGLDDDINGEGGANDHDLIPEPPENPISKPGDLWILGDHRLLCGDSTNPDDVQRLMDGQKAILFATDPPYLVDYDGTNHPGCKEAQDSGNPDWDDSSQGVELYEKFIKVAIDHALEPNAAWYCWHASKRQAMLESVWEKMGAFQHQQIIWNKEKGVLTRSRFLWKHEPCLMGWIKGNMPPKIDGAEYLSTVWDIQGLSGDERPDHPTPKPLECFAIPMRQHVERGSLCYEPFSGSGSQIMAGELTGRRVYAMEISPVYVDVAIKRFIQNTGTIVYLDGSEGKSFDEVASERGVV
ncbi:MAG: DNA modification methylase [Magnetococcales bacterium]|nr:DNA modification methylase [Magnetococcales bacterium]